MKNARPQNSETSAPNKRNFNIKTELFSELSVENLRPVLNAISSKFVGTDNPRHLRAIQALMTRPQRRDQLGKLAGCANTPELVAELRRRGLAVPCERVPDHDRDGRPIQRGVYHFIRSDRRKLSAWMCERDSSRGCAA